MEGSVWTKLDLDWPDDPKFEKLFDIGGHEASGIYWRLIGIIGRAEGRFWAESNFKTLSRRMYFSSVEELIKWIQIFVECELLIFQNECILSNGLNERMRDYDAKSRGGKIGANRRWQKTQPVENE